MPNQLLLFSSVYGGFKVSLSSLKIKVNFDWRYFFIILESKTVHQWYSYYIQNVYKLLNTLLGKQEGLLHSSLSSLKYFRLGFN